MKRLWLSLLLLVCAAFMPDSFRMQQKKYSRVREAYQQNEASLKKEIQAKGFNWPVSQIFLRIFKEEKELELWLRKSDGSYRLYESFPICAASGEPGPKRKEGDNQVPEGFYVVNRFNPTSAFHLSLGINYPNSSDKKLSDKKYPGGDIFIHGSCVSIGCMAMQDETIKKLYLFAVESKTAGKSIPVHIFPCKMNTEKYDELKKNYPGLVAFWKNLEAGFTHFETNKKVPQMEVKSDGTYSLKP